MSYEIVIVLADIHANLPALQAVRDNARELFSGQPLRFWFLGDLFGRGPHPYEVWRELLALRMEATVVGNHDLAISGRNGNQPAIVPQPNGDQIKLWWGDYNEKDWLVLLDHRRRLSHQAERVQLAGWTAAKLLDVQAYLTALPLIHNVQPGVYLIHGGLEQPFVPPPLVNKPPDDWWDLWVWGYVKQPPHVQYTLEGLRWLHDNRPEGPELLVTADAWEPPSVVLVGHYHHQRLFTNGEWQIAGSDDLRATPIIRNHWYDLAPSVDQPVLISPGSVGFCAEAGNRDACYAALLLQKGRITHVQFIGVPYDCAPVLQKMVEYGYPAETIRRLYLSDKECIATL